MLPNRVEHVLADLGALHAGGVPVTFYATLAPGPDRLSWRPTATPGSRCIDGAAELARWQPVLDQLPGLRHDHRAGRRPPARPASRT